MTTQEQAVKEKQLGNEAYKKKDFETALSHYARAIELNPTDISFYTNRAAVYYEQLHYDNCIKECEKAVEVGRESRADFKLIAKALGRIGNAYMKKEDYHKAATYFDKSLAEHRTTDALHRRQQAEKMRKETEAKAYINPEKSLEAKEQGNGFFKVGNYPDALKMYTEAILRNPEDSKLYSNRAACYTKLAEFNLGLKDCDMAIKLEPTFVRAYLRKANILMGLKNMSDAAKTFQKAIELDQNCQEALEGYKKCMMTTNDPEEVKKRAMADPEIQKILADPAMRMILEQMQRDPRALEEHLKNPDVAQKIEKLFTSGLIQIR
ncbi:PREDICTED: stress-induced-phosphoprotein 1-like [Priapulus caudatus]|uniref:Stress-induced-phosphoprotein 1 n=1 Tax=Priapulus caudatus TaxID=37621 RepID=A0ABM1DUF7_PRICU|nr:PREDICTED: stress-induced-phosphoprotein 1-like [Priapulus caudatus]